MVVKRTTQKHTTEKPRAQKRRLALGAARKAEPQAWIAGTHVEVFLEMMVAERGASANTRDAYLRDLGDAAAYLKRRRGLDEAGPEDLRAYMASLEAAGLAPRTAARRRSALRQYFRFLYAEGLRADDPTTNLDAPRLGRPLPKVLSETEVDGLLETARARPGPEPERLRLICLLEVLYATGMRVSSWSRCRSRRSRGTRVS